MLPSSSLLQFDVHTSRRPQISGSIAKKVPTKVINAYVNFADVFLWDLAFEFRKYTGINDRIITLVNGQQPLYVPIYSLELVKLETLKVYIETNLAIMFIRLSKFPVGAPILFDQKSNGFIRLCVDYQGLTNLKMKNRYPLPLIKESLDRLRRARQFIQFDFTSAYHRIRICKDDE